MFYFKKLKSAKLNQGMTYVELIVVLGIFSVMSAVSIYNYGGFQAGVDIRNLANDVALKVVQAQKDASFGKFPAASSSQYALIPNPDIWKPSYGVHVALDSNNPNKNLFYRFVDLNGSKTFNADSGCSVAGECIERVQITKNNTIDSVSLVGSGCNAIDTFVVTFTRPDLTPTIITNPIANCSYTGVQMVVKSPKGNTATIVIDTSGRVQIN